MATPGLRGRFGKSKLVTALAGAALVVSGGLIPTAAMAAPGDEIEFPTDGLHDAVIEALNDESIDGRSDRGPGDPVTKGEAAQLRELDYSARLMPADERLNEFAWLAHFGGLNMLDLDFHSVGSLEHFAGLTELKRLWLSGAPDNPDILNSATDFSPFAGLKSLEYLHLPFNEISDVEGLVEVLKDLDQLKYVQLQSNGIVDAEPLAQLEQVPFFALNDNEISDVTPLAGLSNLQELSLKRNRVADVSPLGTLDLDDIRFVHLDEQRIDLPDALVGETVETPIVGFDGDPVSVSSTSEGYAPGGANDWKFTVAGEKELTWGIGNPFDENNPFSGTITQRIKDPRTPVVPEAPTVDTCVDGEPVVVNPADTTGVEYEPSVTDNGDGTYTVTVTAKAESEDYYLDLSADYEGWDYNAQHLIWTETFTPECDDDVDPEVVEPLAPTVETCVDGEPVVVTDPDGPQGVEYQSRVVENDDGSFTVTTLARADVEQGAVFDVEEPPAGWTHIGDGIFEWSTTVTPDCEPDEELPPTNGEDPKPEPEPGLPPLGADVTTLGISALVIALLGVGLLAVRRKRS